jgi:hypothetical protein
MKNGGELPYLVRKSSGIYRENEKNFSLGIETMGFRESLS